SVSTVIFISGPPFVQSTTAQSNGGRLDRHEESDVLAIPLIQSRVRDGILSTPGNDRRAPAVPRHRTIAGEAFRGPSREEPAAQQNTDAAEVDAAARSAAYGTLLHPRRRSTRRGAREQPAHAQKGRGHDEHDRRQCAGD